MAALFDAATITVEVAFTSTPLTSNAAITAASGWTDISSYVRDMRINRGRQTELSDYSPGTLTMSLDNRTRLFDPSNTANIAPYLNNLKPMRKVRVTATSGAATATIFTGHIMGWPIDYPGITDSEVNVTAVDGFRVLQQIAPPVNAYDATVRADSPTCYWELSTIDSGGISPATVGGVDIVNFNNGDPAFPPSASLPITTPVGPGATISNAGWAANGVPTVAPKTVEGWFVNFQYGVYAGTNVARAALNSTNWIRLAVGSTDGTVSVGYSNSADIKSYTYASTGWQISTGIVHLVLTVTATHLILYANSIEVWRGTLAAVTSTNTFAALPPPSVQAVAQPRTGSPVNPAIYGLAVYPSGLTAAQIQTHYAAGLTGWGHPLGDRAGTRISRILTAIGWPSADTDLGTGSTVLGIYEPGNTALAACQDCSIAEQGLLFMSGDGKVTLRDRQWQMTNTAAITPQATLGDGTGETPYRDIEIDGNHLDNIRNVVTVAYGAGTVIVKDSTSITNYGEQSDSVSAGALPNEAGYLARQLGASRLRIRKDPTTRVPKLEIRPRGKTSTILPTVLGLEIGERVTVTRRPAGATSPFSQACIIQGINHAITPNAWVTVLYLAPVQMVAYNTASDTWLTLGDATYGRIGAAYNNKIPY